MKFTNMSSAGVYFTCCHREVEPGGSFDVPWLEAQNNRAVRAAMADGTLAWESSGDEPVIPGSAHVPTAAEKAKAEAMKKAEEEARMKSEAEALRRRKAADAKALKENMARMGKFKVPGPIPHRTPERAGVKDRPITKADIISNGKPQSLADVMRHNKAVKLVHAQEAVKARQASRADHAGQAGGSGK